MSYLSAYQTSGPKKYSAKNTIKPVNFLCIAPDAHAVYLLGDFNDWDPSATPMSRQHDGSWQAQLNMNPGHHHYSFLIDGKMVNDPQAMGLARNLNGKKVSLVAVS